MAAEVVTDMSLRDVSREALVGSFTLGAVFVAGYLLGKNQPRDTTAAVAS